MIAETYGVPTNIRTNRLFLRPAFRLLFRVLGRVEVTGRENVPSQGPYLIAFNHVSIYDPPVVVAFWPAAPEILAAIEIWTRKGQSELARLYGAIPIRRGEIEREVMLRLLAVLRSGYPLLVSPEGTRSHVPGMQQAKTGIIYLVDKTHVPIVPAAVVGTTDDFFRKAIHGQRPEIKLKIGPAFTIPEEVAGNDGLPPREIRQRKADFIMLHLADLLPEAYRGFYAS